MPPKKKAEKAAEKEVVSEKRRASDKSRAEKAASDKDAASEKEAMSEKSQSAKRGRHEGVASVRRREKRREPEDVEPTPPSKKCDDPRFQETQVESEDEPPPAQRSPSERGRNEAAAESAKEPAASAHDAQPSPADLPEELKQQLREPPEAMTPQEERDEEVLAWATERTIERLGGDVEHWRALSSRLRAKVARELKSQWVERAVLSTREAAAPARAPAEPAPSSDPSAGESVRDPSAGEGRRDETVRKRRSIGASLSRWIASHPHEPLALQYAAALQGGKRSVIGELITAWERDPRCTSKVRGSTSLVESHRDTRGCEAKTWEQLKALFGERGAEQRSQAYASFPDELMVKQGHDGELKENRWYWVPAASDKMESLSQRALERIDSEPEQRAACGIIEREALRHHEGQRQALAYEAAAEQQELEDKARRPRAAAKKSSAATPAKVELRRAVGEHAKVTRQLFAIRHKVAGKKNEWYASMLKSMDEVLEKGGRVELEARHSAAGERELQQLNEHTEELKALVAASKL